MLVIVIITNLLITVVCRLMIEAIRMSKDKKILEKEQRLRAYVARMQEIKDTEKERIEIKEEFLKELTPGKIKIGNYTVATNLFTRDTVMPKNEAMMALEKLGYEKDEIIKIIIAISKQSTSRQFLVKYDPAANVKSIEDTLAAY